MALLACVALGALLFMALLYFITRSSSSQPTGNDPLLEARHALQTLESGLLPRDLITRIFARDDLDYVTSCGFPQISRTFLEERRNIALSWVAMVRQQIESLQRFHRIAARQHSSLSARSELSLAFDFATLMMACRALHIVLLLRGPYAAPRVVGAAITAATRICEVSKQSMAFLNPASIAAAGRGPGGALAS